MRNYFHAVLMAPLLAVLSTTLVAAPTIDSAAQMNAEKAQLIKQRNSKFTQIRLRPSNGPAPAPSINIGPLIVGGTDAPVGAYPWMTALLFADDPDAFYAQFCGGTLIRADLVLTAAHCLDFLRPDQLDVAVGAHVLADVTAQDRIGALAIFIHPGYDPATTDNDIGLIKLSRPSSAQPLTHIDPALMQQIVPGEFMTTMGWGVLNDITFDLPDVLQEVQLPYVDHDTCNSAMYGAITPNQICAGPVNGGLDSCYGDSGGPLIYNANGQYHQAGIVSWGFGCAVPEFYGVYTKVANYNDWIDNAADVIYLPAHIDLGGLGVKIDVATRHRVTNWTGGPETITGAHITGDAGFSIHENSCLNKTLPVNGTCTLELTFKPGHAGPLAATLSLVTASGLEVTSHLTGIGLGKRNFNAALDTIEQPWYTGGHADWAEEATPGSSNGSAVRSGQIMDDEASYVSTRIEGRGTLSFNWRVSSETFYDYLYLIIDGEIVAGITGETDWSTKTITLGNGEHIVNWIYAKDYSVSEGDDAGWLDNVSWVRN